MTASGQEPSFKGFGQGVFAEVAEQNRRGRNPSDKTSDGFLIPPFLIPIVLCIDSSISICFRNHNVYKVIKRGKRRVTPYYRGATSIGFVL
jgi:hypothetical protein